MAFVTINQMTNRTELQGECSREWIGAYKTPRACAREAFPCPGLNAACHTLCHLARTIQIEFSCHHLLGNCRRQTAGTHKRDYQCLRSGRKHPLNAPDRIEWQTAQRHKFQVVGLLQCDAFKDGMYFLLDEWTFLKHPVGSRLGMLAHVHMVVHRSAVAIKTFAVQNHSPQPSSGKPDPFQ